jgi:hypothetical protein
MIEVDPGGKGEPVWIMMSLVVGTVTIDKVGSAGR